MKILKKFFSFCLSIWLGICFCGEGEALYGDTHYMLGEKIIERMEEPLIDANKTAFLSGMVYADIGRFKFDKLCRVQSDSRKFLEALKTNATTDQEQWFVKGVEMHILQDEMTSDFLKNVFGEKAADYPTYIKQCGLLDCYFLKSSGRYIYSDFLEGFNFEDFGSLPEVKELCEKFGIPHDTIGSVCKFTLNRFYATTNKNSLITCDDLLMKTYSNFGLIVTKEDLHHQQANMLVAFIMVTFISGNKQELDQKIIDAIESESDHIVTVCAEQLK